MAQEPERPAGGPARDIFVALSAMDDLLDEAAPPRVGFADMYSIATQPDVVPDDTFQALLRNDETFRRGFYRLLEKVAVTHLPAVAAASDGAVASREAGGIRVHLQESAADPAQIYVIVERLDESAEMPSLLMAETATGTLHKLPLPDAVDGMSQVLLDGDTPIVQALRDAASVLYLR